MKKIKKKDDLLVVADGGFIFCDSRMVARKFEVEHKKVVRTIELVISKNDEIKGDLKAPLNDEFMGDLKSPLNNEFAPNFIRYESEYRKQKFTAYRMNRTAFSLIAMRFETPAAFRWQILFSQAFFKMESDCIRLQAIVASNRSNLEWSAARAIGKPVRRNETDVIKTFVEYATEQGSKNANTYYMNYSRMANSALFDIKNKKIGNIRDACNADQLGTLKVIDKVIAKAIEEDMAQGTQYSKIFQNVKEKVQQFSEFIGKSCIPGSVQQIGM